MKPIALITARGGSKRIPQKNIKLFLGKPIIAYSIEAALRSNLFDEVIVTTDDAKIAEISQQYGAKIPFLRFPETSDDYATTTDVLLEFISRYYNRNTNKDTYLNDNSSICCIYPTAPFVTPELIINAYQKLKQEDLDCVFPIQKFNYPIQRALYKNGGNLFWINPENSQTRSQDLLTTFHDTGQFYFFRVNAFLKNRILLSNNIDGIIVSEMQAQDIDTEEDWHIAELKYELLFKSK